MTSRRGSSYGKTRLKGITGIGPAVHSAYSNEVTIGITSGKAIVVTGKEAFGRYIEYVDAETGKTLGNKVFPND